MTSLSGVPDFTRSGASKHHLSSSTDGRHTSQTTGAPRLQKGAAHHLEPPHADQSASTHDPGIPGSVGSRSTASQPTRPRRPFDRGAASFLPRPSPSLKRSLKQPRPSSLNQSLTRMQALSYRMEEVRAPAPAPWFLRSDLFLSSLWLAHAPTTWCVCVYVCA